MIFTTDPAWYDILAIVLATWRLANMLVNEDGPGRVFVWVRRGLGIVQDDEGKTIGWSDWSPLYCVWCTSLYTAILLLFLPKPVAWVLALSAVACLIDAALEKSRGAS